MLKGKRILITRPIEQAKEWAAQLEEIGLDPIIFPLLEICFIDPGPLFLRNYFKRKYDWLFFTSANGVEGFMRLMRSVGKSLIQYNGVAAVGPATSKKLAEYGLKAKEIPDSYSGKGLADSLGNLDGKYILFPTTISVLPGTLEELENKGANIEKLDVYLTLKRVEGHDELQTILDRGVEVITFTSPSAVEAFVQMKLSFPSETLIAVIGPTTAKKAEESGLKPNIISKKHSTEGLTHILKDMILSSPEANT